MNEKHNPLLYNIPVPIHILSAQVASQIAAGEVIERPASVVKELIENSIDAGAKQIVIHILDAGQRLVEVSDDGCGIPEDELFLSVERHATSKLFSADELFKIETLGFRGEALASIGSVAHLTITSRTAASPTGEKLRVHDGKSTPIEKTGAPVGTTVRAEDLFYNLPVRLKFLKQPSTERRHIDELATRYALAYPHIRFQLYQDDRPDLLTSGNGSRTEILASLYGIEVAKQMLEVLAEEEGLSLTGYVSPISLTRSNRRDITFFVNGRPVQDPALGTALVQAYHTLLMVGRYPLAVLFLQLPADTVDVNVHPTKAEVRFKNPDLVFRGVQRAVRRALLAHSPIPSMSNHPYWQYSQVVHGSHQQVDPAWSMANNPESDTTDYEPGHNISKLQTTGQPVFTGVGVPLLRLIGQIASAYLVAEGPDGLYLIDQHAAHERVLFESFMAMYMNTVQVDEKIKPIPIPAQVLLQPVSVNLSTSYARIIEEQLPILNRLGFQVELFGKGSFLIRAVPSLWVGMDPAAALGVIVEDFEEDETPLQAVSEARIIARVCKRAAIKAGQALSLEEQRALLNDLEACQSPRTCPHGRPTMIHLSVDLLERQFGRKGAR